MWNDTCRKLFPTIKTVSGILFLFTVISFCLPACSKPVEIDPDAAILFKLDRDKNIIFSQLKSGEEKRPDFNILVKAIRNISEPETFEVLTIVPYGKKELVLVTRKHGLLHTTDLGETWERLETGLLPEVVWPFEDHGLTKPVIGVSVSRDKRRFAVLFSESLYLSHDGGRTFSRAPLEGRYKAIEYLCVAWHPDNEKLICIGTALPGRTEACGLYVSGDGGKTVVGIDDGLPGEPLNSPNYLEEITAVTFGADEDTFYVGLGNGGGVYRGSIKERSMKKLDVPELYQYPDGDFYRVEGLAYYRGTLLVSTNRSWKKIIPVDAAGEKAAADQQIEELFLLTDDLISISTLTQENLSFSPAYKPKRSFSPDQRVYRKKALYISYTFTQRENYSKLIELLRLLKLNAVVINMKDDSGYIHADSNDPLLTQVPNALSPYVQFRETAAKLKTDGIYVIGRMVVFKDDQLYNFDNYKYAIKYAGGAPLQKGPEKWVDPYSEFVWDYNIAAAKAVSELGVDEIQFDYIRFPDLKGDLITTARYDSKKENQLMREALVSFLKKAKSRLSVPVSIDLFGYQAIYKFGMWIGQDITELAAQVDVISPMFYPSHYSGGYALSYGDKRVYYTIYLSCKRALELIGDAYLRPYIQAFYYNFRNKDDNYGVDYIGWELDGLKNCGVQDYIFWNNLSEYATLINGMKKYLGEGAEPVPHETTANVPRQLPFSSVLVNP
jgi:hypothetical protein